MNKIRLKKIFKLIFSDISLALEVDHLRQEQGALMSKMEKMRLHINRLDKAHKSERDKHHRMIHERDLMKKEVQSSGYLLAKIQELEDELKRIKR